MATKKKKPSTSGARRPKRPTNGNKTLPGNAVSTDERMTDDQEAMIVRKVTPKRK